MCLSLLGIVFMLFLLGSFVLWLGLLERVWSLLVRVRSLLVLGSWSYFFLLSICWFLLWLWGSLSLIVLWIHLIRMGWNLFSVHQFVDSLALVYGHDTLSWILLLEMIQVSLRIHLDR